MTLVQRPVNWSIALLIIATAAGTGSLHAASQSAERPQLYRRDPLKDATSSPRAFQTAVKLVKLDSCDPAILAKPQMAPMDSKDAAARSRARADMDRYHDVLAAYAAGDLAGAIAQLAAFDRERFERTLGSVNRRGVDRHAPWDGRRYAQAVMLHTDAGLHLAGGTYGGEIYDQLQMAADLLHLGAKCAPENVRPLAPRWYVGLSRFFRDRTVLHLSEALLELGRKRLEADPAILGESGLLAESMATIYALSPTGAAPTWTGGDAQVVRRIAERREAWLGDAVKWFGQASDLEPGNDEALLHLGRARALRSEDAGALRTLGTVLERTPSDGLAYLAGIFTGAVHDRKGRLDEAAAAYRAALARHPYGHAGRIGLAETLRQSGRVDEARDLLRALAAEPADRVREPFWWYLLEPPGAADARLAALRAEVRR
jgi:tetratricopeptide (TPR) repeat protein